MPPTVTRRTGTVAAFFGDALYFCGDTFLDHGSSWDGSSGSDPSSTLDPWAHHYAEHDKYTWDPDIQVAFITSQCTGSLHSM